MEGHDGHGLWLASGLRTGCQNACLSARPPNVKLVDFRFRLLSPFVCFFISGKTQNDRSDRQTGSKMTGQTGSNNGRATSVKAER